MRAGLWAWHWRCWRRMGRAPGRPAAARTGRRVSLTRSPPRRSSRVFDAARRRALRRQPARCRRRRGRGWQRRCWPSHHERRPGDPRGRRGAVAGWIRRVRRSARTQAAGSVARVAAPWIAEPSRSPAEELLRHPDRARAGVRSVGSPTPQQRFDPFTSAPCGPSGVSWQALPQPQPWRRQRSHSPRASALDRRSARCTASRGRIRTSSSKSSRRRRLTRAGPAFDCRTRTPRSDQGTVARVTVASARCAAGPARARPLAVRTADGGRSSTRLGESGYLAVEPGDAVRPRAG